MPASPAESPGVVLVWGDDDFAVKRRARQIFSEWSAHHAGADEETIEATSGNGDEALKALARLREALQTLPFFGGTKSIWFCDCNFLGDDRVSEGQAVLEALGDMARELSSFRWDGVRLLISAGRIDRRRGFFKTLEKLAAVEHFAGLSWDDKEWQDKAESLAAGEFRALGKKIDGDGLSAFVEQVGPNARQLSSEAMKLVNYVGDRAEIGVADVEAVVTRGRHARAFALGDAFGDRNLPKAMRCLDDELWAMQTDKQRSEIGLLFGLISKVRAMLLAKEMHQEGLLKASSDYRAFTVQVASLKALPPGRLPVDRRYNPLLINAYVLFRASQHSRNFSREELVAIIADFLACNRQLVGSGLDSGMLLQLALTRALASRSPAPETPRLDARRVRA